MKSRNLIKLGVVGLSIFASNFAFSAAQRVGSYEISVDAPSRMEPRGNYGSWDYGKIPIQITLQDLPNFYNRPDCDIAEDIQLFFGISSGVAVGCHDKNPKTFTKIEVFEGKPDSQYPIESTPGHYGPFGYDLKKTYTVANLTEIEFTIGTWQKDTPTLKYFPSPQGVSHGICSNWNDSTEDDCVNGITFNHSTYGTYTSPATNLATGLSEWHATLHYAPTSMSGGTKLMVRIHMVNTDNKVLVSDTFLKVNYGQKLPKFNKDWAYGDLHYHSQGTDNGGESGYSYRGVRHAMNAMGIDWLYATDHANNTDQLNYIDPELFPAFVNGWFGLFGMETNLSFISDPLFFGVSDMSPSRWTDHFHLLHDDENNPYTGKAGANSPHLGMFEKKLLDGVQPMFGKQYSNPQIFLGGELDVIPETERDTSSNPPDIGVIPGHQLALHDICDFLPIELKEELEASNPIFRFLSDTAKLNDGYSPSSKPICKLEDIRKDAQASGPKLSQLIKDIQGKNLKYSRQHLIYLPSSQSDDTAGIMSNTGFAGGATRSLNNVLNEVKAKNGYVFAAHPLEREKGDGIGRLGPDMIPWSKYQLEKAFDSEVFLGLQAWNQNTRFSRKMGIQEGVGCSSVEQTIKAQERYEDTYHLYQPSKTKNQVLGTGQTCTVQKPDFNYDTVKNLMYETFAGVALWDLMSLWGLDKRKTDDLSWLPTGQPRKIFLAGGSDAHGDFNHRRTGYAFGTSSINNTTLGTPRNLVNTGEPDGAQVSKALGYGAEISKSWSQSQVIDGIKSGEFIVTDGPIVRIVVDTNFNGKIDEDDVPMGDYHHQNSNADIQLVVEWKSSTEFGGIDRIDLIVGAFDNTTHKKGYIFAHRDHTEVLYSPPYFDKKKIVGYAGTIQKIMYEKKAERQGTVPTYVLNHNGSTDLRIVPDAFHKYTGKATVTLKVLDYQLFDLVAAGQDYQSTNKQSPDRLFVRAHAVSNNGPYHWNLNGIGNKCADRDMRCAYHMAYSNPVYIGIN